MIGTTATGPNSGILDIADCLDYCRAGGSSPRADLQEKWKVKTRHGITVVAAVILAVIVSIASYGKVPKTTENSAIADKASYLADVSALLRKKWPRNRTVNIVVAVDIEPIHAGTGPRVAVIFCTLVVIVACRTAFVPLLNM